MYQLSLIVIALTFSFEALKDGGGGGESTPIPSSPTLRNEKKPRLNWIKADRVK